MAELNWFSKELLVHVEVTARKNISKGLQLIKASAKAKCPVGVEEKEIAKTGKNAGKPWTSRKPGTLKKSIRTRMSKKKLSGQVIAGGRSSSDLTAYYAHIVERGSSKTPARPFMRPALEENFETVMAGFTDTLK